MSHSRINLEVFCKRNSTRGVVVAEGNGTLTIQTGGVNKVVTEGTFKRWYTIIPQDHELDNSSSLTIGNETEFIPDSPSSSNALLGNELRAKFIAIVRSSANQPLDFTYDYKNKRDIIKYNGKNVFECTTAKKRFNVLCHPKALTPDNLKRADRIVPKSWGWVLSAKFVFTDLSQVPLMRSIIADSLFYRQSGDL